MIEIPFLPFVRGYDMAVLEMLAEIFEDSPEIRPDSPPIRPADFGNISKVSPNSPSSPLLQADKPDWCTGGHCHRYEENGLPRRGLTPGCIIPGRDMETWRRLDSLTNCPKRKSTIH